LATRIFPSNNLPAVAPSIPSVRELYWPTAKALRDLGGSGTIQEIAERVIENEGFDEETQAIPHGTGSRTEVEYRLAWARTHLKMAGLLENSARGVWSLTEKGRRFDPAEVGRVAAEVRATQTARPRPQEEDLLVEEDDEGAGETNWKDELIETLLALPPDKFERLAARLLRETGFISATVTGRSGDGGIDGIGVYRLSLVSFQVFFQCKRHRGSVRPSDVRDFCGAMAGRGDKGLIITTAGFTADARQEATRDGAPPIDLIDGERLCDLLREQGLGVETTVRQIEDVSLNPEFFDEI
jgi:restriction system protein